MASEELRELAEQLVSAANRLCAAVGVGEGQLAAGEAAAALQAVWLRTDQIDDALSYKLDADDQAQAAATRQEATFRPPGPLEAAVSGRHMDASEWLEGEVLVDRVDLDSVRMRVFRRDRLTADDLELDAEDEDAEQRLADVNELAMLELERSQLRELRRRLAAALHEPVRHDPRWDRT